MILAITTRHQPATDLGFLLHKHPAKIHQKTLNFGVAAVFYPLANADIATAVLAVDIDPIGLVRRDNESFALSQYVNDRPYAASSFLSVAIGACFASALGGRCRDKPELAEVSLPFEARVIALPCGSNALGLLERLFVPLGYQLEVRAHVLNADFPDWGNSKYVDLTLRANCTLKSLLEHLYVLIPVLDNDKHYWIGNDEVDKLIAKSAAWLSTHPERQLITRRYLKNQRVLVHLAMTQFAEDDAAIDTVEETIDVTAVRESREEQVERPLALNAQRLQSITDLCVELGAQSVLDLGCGEGKLLRKLLDISSIKKLVGVDVSLRVLQTAAIRLNFERMSERQRERITLLHGSLIYCDPRLANFDVACVIEVIEHLDTHRLAAFARVLFKHVSAQHILLSTPNVEFNVKFENLANGLMRHADHRFEWTRAEFQLWAQRQALDYGYEVRFLTIGAVDADLGAPTQLAHFAKNPPFAVAL